MIYDILKVLAIPKERFEKPTHNSVSSNFFVYNMKTMEIHAMTEKDWEKFNKMFNKNK